MANEKAVLKVISNQTREYTDLLKRYNTLMIVHLEVIEKSSKIECKRYELRKDNVELRKIIKQWEIDNATLQESLDQAERELMDATRMDWGGDSAFKQGRRGGGDVYTLDKEEDI